MVVNTYMKNMEPLSCPGSFPNGLLLQGERGSGHSSSELSSSEGVWLVRKGEKMRKSGNCRKLPTKSFINDPGFFFFFT